MADQNTNFGLRFSVMGAAEAEAMVGGLDEQIRRFNKELRRVGAASEWNKTIGVIKKTKKEIADLAKVEKDLFKSLDIWEKQTAQQHDALEKQKTAVTKAEVAERKKIEKDLFSSLDAWEKSDAQHSKALEKQKTDAFLAEVRRRQKAEKDAKDTARATGNNALTKGRFAGMSVNDAQFQRDWESALREKNRRETTSGSNDRAAYLKDTGARIGNMGTALRDVFLSMRQGPTQGAKAMQGLRSSIDDVSASLHLMHRRTEGIRETLIGAQQWAQGGLIAGVAGIAGSTKLAMAAGDYDMRVKAISHMLGGNKQGSDFAQQLKEFDRASPVTDFNTTLEAGQQALGAGMKPEELLNKSGDGIFTLLGDVVATMGKGPEEFSAAMTQILQAKNQNKVQMQDIRALSQSAGLPIMQILEKGLDPKRFKSAMNGEEPLNWQEFIDAFRKGAQDKELGYKGGMGRMMDTLPGAMANLQSAAQQAAIAIGNTLVPAIQGMTAFLTKVADVATAIANNPLGKVLVAITTNLGLFGSVILALGSAIIIPLSILGRFVLVIIELASGTGRLAAGARWLLQASTKLGGGFGWLLGILRTVAAFVVTGLGAAIVFLIGSLILLYHSLTTWVPDFTKLSDEEFHKMYGIWASFFDWLESKLSWFMVDLKGETKEKGKKEGDAADVKNLADTNAKRKKRGLRELSMDEFRDGVALNGSRISSGDKEVTSGAAALPGDTGTADTKGSGASLGKALADIKDLRATLTATGEGLSLTGGAGGAGGIGGAGGSLTSMQSAQEAIWAAQDAGAEKDELTRMRRDKTRLGWAQSNQKKTEAEAKRYQKKLEKEQKETLTLAAKVELAGFKAQIQSRKDAAKAARDSAKDSADLAYEQAKEKADSLRAKGYTTQAKALLKSAARQHRSALRVAERGYNGNLGAIGRDDILGSAGIIAGTKSPQQASALLQIAQIRAASKGSAGTFYGGGTSGGASGGAAGMAGGVDILGIGQAIIADATRFADYRAHLKRAGAKAAQIMSKAKASAGSRGGIQRNGELDAIRTEQYGSEREFWLNLAFWWRKEKSEAEKSLSRSATALAVATKNQGASKRIAGLKASIKAVGKPVRRKDFGRYNFGKGKGTGAAPLPVYDGKGRLVGYAPDDMMSANSPNYDSPDARFDYSVLNKPNDEQPEYAPEVREEMRRVAEQKRRAKAAARKMREEFYRQFGAKAQSAKPLVDVAALKSKVKGLRSDIAGIDQHIKTAERMANKVVVGIQYKAKSLVSMSAILEDARIRASRVMQGLGQYDARGDGKDRKNMSARDREILARVNQANALVSGPQYANGKYTAAWAAYDAYVAASKNPPRAASGVGVQLQGWGDSGPLRVPIQGRQNGNRIEFFGSVDLKEASMMGIL